MIVRIKRLPCRRRRDLWAFARKPVPHCRDRRTQKSIGRRADADCLGTRHALANGPLVREPDSGETWDANDEADRGNPRVLEKPVEAGPSRPRRRAFAAVSSTFRRFAARPFSIPTSATLKSRAQRYTYGTHGTPTTDALSSAWSDISGAAGTVLVPSGLAAIVVSLMAALSAGDHLLDDQLGLRPRPRLRRQDPEADGDRDDLVRSPDRRRNRGADEAEHQGDIGQVAGLAVVRDPGRARDRRSRARPRGLRHHGQHLGDAAVLRPARPWRRHGGRGGHEIPVGTFRPASGPGLGQRGMVRAPPPRASN